MKDSKYSDVQEVVSLYTKIKNILDSDSEQHFWKKLFGEELYRKLRENTKNNLILPEFPFEQDVNLFRWNQKYRFACLYL